MNITAKTMPVCNHCGSEDILADGYLQWNSETSEWEMSNVFDKGAWCNACDGQSTIKWVWAMESNEVVDIVK